MANDCIISPYKSRGPLGHVHRWVSTEGKKTTRGAHVLAYEAAYGPIPKGMCVCHTCDNPPCVNPTHLWLGTSADNTRDRCQKGRSAKGEKHGCAKLTETEVQDIKMRLNIGEPTKYLAKRFRVTQRLIQYIKASRNWSHIT